MSSAEPLPAELRRLFWEPRMEWERWPTIRRIIEASVRRVARAGVKGCG